MFFCCVETIQDLAFGRMCFMSNRSVCWISQSWYVGKVGTDETVTLLRIVTIQEVLSVRRSVRLILSRQRPSYHAFLRTPSLVLLSQYM